MTIGRQARLSDLFETRVEIVFEPWRDLPRRTQLTHLLFDLRHDLRGHPAAALADPDTGEETSPIRSGNATNPVAPSGVHDLEGGGGLETGVNDTATGVLDPGVDREGTVEKAEGGRSRIRLGSARAGDREPG